MDITAVSINQRLSQTLKFGIIHIHIREVRSEDWIGAESIERYNKIPQSLIHKIESIHESLWFTFRIDFECK